MSEVPLALADLNLTSLSNLSRWVWTALTIFLVTRRSLALALADGLGLQVVTGLEGWVVLRLVT